MRKLYFGLDGGINTCGYANENPLLTVDPTGLVTWSGTYEERTFLTRSKASFRLTSECDFLNKRKITVRVEGEAATVGLGKSFLGLSSSEGSVKFNDGHATASPSVFYGLYVIESIGVTLGEFDFSRTTFYLGDAVSTEVNTGWGGGVGFSTTLVGDVTSVSVLKVE